MSPPTSLKPISTSTYAALSSSTPQNDLLACAVNLLRQHGLQTIMQTQWRLLACAPIPCREGTWQCWMGGFGSWPFFARGVQEHGPCFWISRCYLKSRASSSAWDGAMPQAYHRRIRLPYLFVRKFDRSMRVSQPQARGSTSSKSPPLSALQRQQILISTAMHRV